MKERAAFELILVDYQQHEDELGRNYRDAREVARRDSRPHRRSFCRGRHCERRDFAAIVAAVFHYKARVTAIQGRRRSAWLRVVPSHMVYRLSAPSRSKRTPLRPYHRRAL